MILDTGGRENMHLFAMSRLSRLDVKWANRHNGKFIFNSWGHSNPYFELIMVTEGPVFLLIGSEKVELRSGECLLLQPWEEHREWKNMTEDAGFFWVQFSASPVMAYLGADKSLEGKFKEDHAQRQELRTVAEYDDDPLLIPRRFRPLRRYEILSLFEKLIHEKELPHGYFRYRSTILLMQIIQLIADDLLHRNHIDTALPGTFLIYRNIVNFLNERYCQDLSKEVLERNLTRTHEYLCQIFKKYSGISIVTYIHQLRIQRAKYLLLGSDKTIHDISQEVGFQDPYYFCRIFKRLEGMTPTQYRSAKTLDGSA